MTPEKMTGEELKQARKVADALNEKKTSTVHRLLAHIAALTAERNNWKRMHESNVTAAAGLAVEFNHAGVGDAQNGVFTRARALLDERDALRERVRALEAETHQLREDLDSTANAFGQTSQALAAIRQRAGDGKALAEVARRSDATWKHEVMLEVGRYILGDDAPPSEMDGLRGEMAEKPERICEHVGEGVEGVECTTCAPPGVPEPTTAEAFATVREEVANGIPSDRNRRALDALSLLERRMGALWRTFAEEMAHWPTCPSGNDFSEAGWAKCDCHMGQVRALLTDAPPVFTLEEGKRAILNASNAKRGECEDRYRVGIQVALDALESLRR